MVYEIKTINNKNEIKKCPEFHVDKYNWGGNYRPITYGKMAYIKDEGFIIHLTCEEKNPKRIYINDEDPVYEDSAMEAFIEFDPINKKGVYVNIEANANGAMLNRFGEKPPGRQHYRNFTNGKCTCNAKINDESWELEVLISKEYVKDLFGKETFTTGDRIRCNFYKLCGTNSHLEHYGSYTLINAPTWNFHLPEFFADAVITD